MPEHDIQLIAGVKADAAQIAREGERIAKALYLPLGKISSHASEFTKSLDAAIARTTAFGAAAGSLFAVTDAFKKLVSVTIEVETQLTEINSLLRLGSNDIAKFSSNLFRAANSVSVSFSDAAKVAQEFSRQGLSVENTLKRTTAALSLMKLSGLTIETSVAAITSTLNAFNKEALDEIEIVNRLANVDANFAVSARDLAEGIKRANSAAADAGVSFNQLLALITSAKQVTQREGSVIGNSLKTIFTRLERPQVLEDLEAAGIKVRDLNGKSLPLIQTLRNLSTTYDSLASSQKSFVAETVGGVYQINILKSILADLGSDVSIFDGALKAAENSTGAANERFKVLNETISSKLIRTFNDLKEVSSGFGSIVFTPTIKGGLDIVDKVFKNFAERANPNSIDFLSIFDQGLAKGISNFLSGPGIQLIFLGISKLIDKFRIYISEAFKELSGVNAATKIRLELEESIVNTMRSEQGLLQRLISGNETLASFAARYANDVHRANLELQQASLLARTLTGAFVPKGPSVKPSVGGLYLGTTSSIPHLSMMGESIKGALARENRLTGGNAALSQSNQLISPSNPYGLVAIDKRTQKNADDAIKQHISAGQSMTQIRKAKSDIPNLAFDTSNAVLLSALLGVFQTGVKEDNFKTIGEKLKEAFGSLFFFLNKEAKQENALLNTKIKSVRAHQAWVQQVEGLQKELIVSRARGHNTPFNIPLQKGGTLPISTLEEFDEKIGPSLRETKQELSDFSEALTAKKVKIRNFGFGAAIGGSIVGGFASTAVGKFSPDAGKGIEDFTSGIVGAGQVLSVFQGNFGKLGASFLALNGLATGVETFFKGIEGQRKLLDTQQTKTQQMVSSIDGAISSLSTLSSMYTDSSVSLDALNREQRKLTESLSQLAGRSPEGTRLSAAIQATPDINSKIKLLSFAKELESRKLNEASNLFSLKELGAEKSLFGKIGAPNGIFAADNLTEKARIEGIVQSNAGGILASLSNEEKNRLIKKVNNTTAFREILGNNEVAKTTFGAIREVGGKDSDINLLVQELRKLIGFEAAGKNPNVISLRSKIQKDNADAQFSVDLASRNFNSFQRLLLNLGSLKSDNQFDIQSIGTKGAFNQSLIGEALRRGQSSTIGFLNGDKTIAAFDLQTELQRINAERKQRVSNAENKFGREFLNQYSQNLDVLGKPSERMDKDMTRNPYIPIPGNDRVNFLNALNTGLGEVSKEGLGKFATENGGFNFPEFEKRLIELGGGSESTNKMLQGYLQSNRGTLDAQKLIASKNNEIVDILQDTYKEDQIQTAKFNALIKELDVKKQANFLGGTRLLTDRGFRREVQQNFRRGATLMDRGSTLQSRAQGAALFLQSLRDLGRNPLEVAERRGNVFVPKDRSPQSLAVAKALNLETQGLKKVQEQVATNIGKSLGRGPGAQLFQSQIINPLINQARGREEMAGVAVSATNRPEGAQIIDSAINEARNGSQKLFSDLNSAAEKVNDFAVNLEDVGVKVAEAFRELGTARQNQKETADSTAEILAKAIKEALEKLKVPAENSAPQNGVLGQISGFATRNASSLLIGGALLASNQGFRNSVKKGAVGGFNLGKTGGSKLFDVFKEGLIGESSSYYGRKIGRVEKAPTSGNYYGPSAPNDILEFNRREKINKYLESRKQRPPKMPVIHLGEIPFPGGKKLYKTLEKEMAERYGPFLPSIKYGKEGIPPRYSPPVYDYFAAGKRLFATNPKFENENTTSGQFAKGTGVISVFSGKSPSEFSRTKTYNPAKEFRPLLGPNLPEKYGPFPPKHIRDSIRDTKLGFAAGAPNLGQFGGLASGMIASQISDSPYAFLGGSLAAQYLGPQAAALFAAKGSIGGAFGASALLTAGSIAGTAFGGLKGGNALYRGFNKKSFEGIGGLSELANSSLYTSVVKDFKKGKSLDEVRQRILAQVTTDKNTLSQSLGGDGTLGSIRRFFSGTGEEGKITKESIAKNEELLKNLVALKDSIDEQTQGQKSQKDLITALQKIAEGGSGGKTTITVEISLKDADRLPEIFNSKVIKPLEEQLKKLQGKVGGIETKIGVSPAPATV